MLSNKTGETRIFIRFSLAPIRKTALFVFFTPLNSILVLIVELSELYRSCNVTWILYSNTGTQKSSRHAYIILMYWCCFLQVVKQWGKGNKPGLLVEGKVNVICSMHTLVYQHIIINNNHITLYWKYTVFVTIFGQLLFHFFSCFLHEVGSS